jgi:hypothetical protein
MWRVSRSLELSWEEQLLKLGQKILETELESASRATMRVTQTIIRKPSATTADVVARLPEAAEGNLPKGWRGGAWRSSDWWLGGVREDFACGSVNFRPNLTRHFMPSCVRMSLAAKYKRTFVSRLSSGTHRT